MTGAAEFVLKRHPGNSRSNKCSRRNSIRWRFKRCFCQRVRKRNACGVLLLPFVATGSIPRIYRREGHSPGDPDEVAPLGNDELDLPIVIAVFAELFQRQQAEFKAEVVQSEFSVVVVVFAFPLHAA